MTALRPLEQARAALWRAFAAHRWELRSFCECCLDEAQVHALRATPVNALTDAQLDSLRFNLVNTVGDVEDGLASLPRWLERCTCDADWDDVALLMNKLPLDDAQRAAVQGFQRAQLLEWLRDDAPVGELLPHLERLGVAFDALPHVGEVAPRWYAGLILELGKAWAAPTPFQEVLGDALLTTARLATLEAGFHRAQRPEHQALFSHAVQVLEWFS